MFINRRLDKENVVHIYMVEYYSAMKKTEIMLVCSNMDGPRECYTE